MEEDLPVATQATCNTRQLSYITQGMSWWVMMITIVSSIMTIITSIKTSTTTSTTTGDLPRVSTTTHRKPTGIRARRLLLLSEVLLLRPNIVVSNCKLRLVLLLLAALQYL